MPEPLSDKSTSDDRPGYDEAVEAALRSLMPDGEDLSVSPRERAVIRETVAAAYPIIEAAVRRSILAGGDKAYQLADRILADERADERHRIVEALRSVRVGSYDQAGRRSETRLPAYEVAADLIEALPFGGSSTEDRTGA